LTVGLVDGDSRNQLSSVGLTNDFKTWSVTTGISNADCAVFWMDPRTTTATRTKGDVVVAQLTLPTSYTGTAQLGVTGKTKSNTIWRQDGVVFHISPSNSTTSNSTASNTTSSSGGGAASDSANGATTVNPNNCICQHGIGTTGTEFAGVQSCRSHIFTCGTRGGARSCKCERKP